MCQCQCQCLSLSICFLHCLFFPFLYIFFHFLKIHISLQVRQWELQKLSVVLFMEASFPCVNFKHNSGEKKETVMFDLNGEKTTEKDRYFIKVIWLVHTATLFDLHEKVYIYVMISVRPFEQVTEKLDTSTRFKIIDESCILDHIPTFFTKQCPDNLVSSITFVVRASIPSTSVQAGWLGKKTVRETSTGFEWSALFNTWNSAFFPPQRLSRTLFLSVCRVLSVADATF